MMRRLAVFNLQLLFYCMDTGFSLRKVNEESFVSDIVRNDYRAADVFRKYGINYCCGGKWPLQIICANMGIDANLVVRDLNQQLVNEHLQPLIDGYSEWNVSFLIDFILNINHPWLLRALPVVTDVAGEFVGKHTKKFPELEPLVLLVAGFSKHMIQNIQQEEQSFFPYIKQLEHAFINRESYGSMFVKTLRKPLVEQMLNETKQISAYLQQARSITQQYTLPQAPCTSHHVTFKKLHELDKALTLLQSLKYDTLYNKAIIIEKEVLKGNG